MKAIKFQERINDMNFYEGLRIGILEIRSHKLRAFLTLSGIAVGIISVMSMTGIMSGFQKGMRESVARSGLGRLYVWPQTTNTNKNQSSGLLYEDALSIRQHFPDIPTVSPIASMETNLFFGNFNGGITVKGITPDWTKLDWNYKLTGRFINPSDVREYAKVCVLIKKRKDKSEFWRQEDVLDPLFKRYDPMHKTVRIGQTAFRVVGILEEGPRDDMNGDTEEQNVLVPITSFQKRLSLEVKQVNQIDLDSGDADSSYPLAKRVFGLLKRRHRGVEDFEVKNIADMMGAMMNWANTITAVMGTVAGIALFAGGVGIMNITLASVNARIKEIGIRKSVGAREKDIKLQFLLEAMALSLSGGVLGVTVGCGICYLIKVLAHMAMLPSFTAIGAALLVSIGVGVAFSWYPARQAAQLDPVEALRYE
ncbi:MAG: ABC transporter permease [Elusimicrobia bacterium]|nr:ABC transporter permease [Elusimicrobiota bacterium]